MFPNPYENCYYCANYRCFARLFFKTIVIAVTATVLICFVKNVFSLFLYLISVNACFVSNDFMCIKAKKAE